MARFFQTAAVALLMANSLVQAGTPGVTLTGTEAAPTGYPKAITPPASAIAV